MNNVPDENNYDIVSIKGSKKVKGVKSRYKNVSILECFCDILHLQEIKVIKFSNYNYAYIQ